ncbi:MAG: GNAT family N-acetyltransferase [Candidatus Promineifilaceae bacterium]|nr:GNAT family N-acetyltransferase [Candidatus Promineifilaceae bacterium]
MSTDLVETTGRGAFVRALTRLYLEDPCGLLPNALWKTVQQAATCQTWARWEEEGVCELQMWQSRRLFLFWQRVPRPENLLPLLDELDLVLLHADYLASPAVHASVEHLFDARQDFFRLLHRHNSLPDAPLPAPFTLEVVAPRREATEIAAFIGRCYENLHPSPETVDAWTAHPTFAPELWIWLVHRLSGRRAALGIAELDVTIGEGSLEWIQVLPEFRGRGLGSAMVAALLRRLADQAEFTTVSGQVDNRTRPELLYRRCGFVGDDVWCVLRRAV